METWRQDLFDLMANKHIRLVVTGTMGNIEATLVETDNQHWPPHDLGEVYGADTFEDAMEQLMEQARGKR